MSTARSRTKAVTFRLEAPEARSVALAGDFNAWDPKRKPLKRRKDGVWWGTVRLSPGSYQYKFVVNGTDWLEDPNNSNRVPNEYGSLNSVCLVA